MMPKIKCPTKICIPLRESLEKAQAELTALNGELKTMRELFKKVTLSCPMCLSALINMAVKDMDYVAANEYWQLLDKLKSDK